ncbi:hypothetical protein C1Y26_35010, partial [Pseudomonas sp. MPR-R2A7]
GRPAVQPSRRVGQSSARSLDLHGRNGRDRRHSVGGRHPVVEDALAKRGERFVANDCRLSEDSRLWLVTGPNMGGKSTFLRQNAAIAVLAQA